MYVYMYIYICIYIYIYTYIYIYIYTHMNLDRLPQVCVSKYVCGVYIFVFALACLCHGEFSRMIANSSQNCQSAQMSPRLRAVIVDCVSVWLPPY